jgi:hypothetical protein
MPQSRLEQWDDARHPEHDLATHELVYRAEA